MRALCLRCQFGRLARGSAANAFPFSLLLMWSSCINAQPRYAASKEVIDSDLEHRLNHVTVSANDSMLDLTAMEGLPLEYQAALSSYCEEILTAIGAQPIQRQHFYHDKHRKGEIYPLGASPVHDVDMLVPLVLLPRPKAILQWIRSGKGRELGWRDIPERADFLNGRHGRTLLFDRGVASNNPVTTPALPFEGQLAAALFMRRTILELGKLVDSPTYDGSLEWKDVTASLEVGKEGGATVLAEFRTILTCPTNRRLRWVSTTRGSEVRQFLGYGMVDGNGALRSHGYVTEDRISGFVRPLKCSQYQPKIGQHDELLLPTPIKWPSKRPPEVSSKEDLVPHEEWCLDEWFSARPEACWVLRLADDSKPLRESFLLMPGATASEQSVFFVAVFADTEPAKLITELSALFRVSADPVLQSKDTMRQLSSLYSIVRDFPLAE